MLASFSTPISDFFSWWGGELADVLKLSTSSAEKGGQRAVIAVSAETLKLIEPAVQNAESAAARGEAVGLAAMLDFLSRLAQSKAPPAITLRFPYRTCFVRSVILPASAAADFERLLQIDLERATPFKHKDVYTAYLADPSQNGTRTQKLKQLVIKRSLVDGIRADIEALGLTIGAIECWNEVGTAALPANFLNEKKAPPRTPALTLSLAVAVVVLAASAAYIVVDQHEAALLELQTRNAALKVKAQAARDAMAKSQAAVAAIASLSALRRETVSRAAILEEITRVLPDSAWITDLKINRATVDIAGLASSASTLVPQLEKSPFFVDAMPTAPLTFDPRENKERFGIRMRLRNVAVAPGEHEGDVQ
ncbi:MAG: PilN domain-containing protein [Hyphomicrobium sp.]|jgi:general secretion pathway protein L